MLKQQQFLKMNKTPDSALVTERIHIVSKSLINEDVLDLNLRSALEADFEGTIEPSMKKPTKIKISNLLVRIRKKMNEGTRAEGIRNSFRETCLPDHDMHRGLKEFLDLHPPVAPETRTAELPAAPLSPGTRLLDWSPDPHKFMCPAGCGEGYASDKSKSWKCHPKSCWLQRSTPMTPIRERTVAAMNSKWTVGLVGEAVDFNGKRSCPVSLQYKN